MDEAFQQLNGGQLIALSAITIGGLVGLIVAVVAITTPHWRRVRQTEAEIALKREMVAAGYSAADISQVLQASGLPGARAAFRRSAEESPRVREARLADAP